MQPLSTVEVLQRQLRSELAKDGRRDMLRQLIQQLVKSRFQNCNLELAKADAKIDRTIRKIMQIDQECSGVNRYRQILMESACSAYHLAWLRRSEGDFIGRSMELLADNSDHAKMVMDQKAVFLVGRTRAGKSTATAFFLRKLLEFYDREGGESLIKLAQVSEEDPQIGNDYGISHTLLAQAYANDRLKEKKAVLVDCGGFGDSRGLDHDLCVNLSMDQMMKSVHKIQALVLVISANDFSMSSNGRNALEVLEEVQKRFPGIIESERLDHNVHLLVTHGENLDEREFTSGQRFDQFLNPIRGEIARQKQNRETDLSDLLRKETLWSFLKRLSEGQRVTVMDIEDEDQREECLESYLADGAEIHFRSSIGLRGGERYRKELELYYGRWVELLHRYFSIPNVVAGKQQKIVKIEQNNKLWAQSERMFKGRIINLRQKVKEATKDFKFIRAHSYDLTVDVRELFDEVMARQEDESLKSRYSDLTDLSDAVQTKIDDKKWGETFKPWDLLLGIPYLVRQKTDVPRLKDEIGQKMKELDGMQASFFIDLGKHLREEKKHLIQELESAKDDKERVAESQVKGRESITLAKAKIATITQERMDLELLFCSQRPTLKMLKRFVRLALLNSQDGDDIECVSEFARLFDRLVAERVLDF